MPLTPDVFEQLGSLYLGRVDENVPFVIDSRTLTTHAFIAGITGSGKTGLGVALLEEAAIDGIPAIVVDPKGDLASLLLTFSDLAPASFAPWVPPGEDPARVAMEHAEGLARFGQDGARVGRYASSERIVFTPGARFGRPLSPLPSLSAPGETEGDPEALRERAVTTASAFLSLAGHAADPRSGEHTLLSSILLDAWSNARSLDLPGLLRAVQMPPFPRLGVMDVDAVVPPKDRAALAVSINGALASPALAGFIDGEPLDVASLFYSPTGRPRLSILSIAHLSDADRSFFVTVLLGELVRWMRAQQGTSSLRALFYMDEIAGYFPPVAEPATKAPMLTLLKQARAFGLGIVLATQNPIDLDYRGLSNCGTWWLGRLPTERDRLRVLDGLQAASSEAGHSIDRSALESALATMPPRTFFHHSVRAGAPQRFEVRHTLSYLRGPLAREELTRLSAQATPAPPTPSLRVATSSIGAFGVDASKGARPVLPPDVRESFLVRTDLASGFVYRPGALLIASVAYKDRIVQLARRLALIAPIREDGPSWSDAWVFEGAPPLEDAPRADASFSELAVLATRAAAWSRWEKSVVQHVVSDRPLRVAEVRELELVAAPGETREAFAARLALTLRERRDAEVDSLVSKWQPKIERAKAKVEKTGRQIEDATADRNTYVVASGLEVGATVLGAMFGRRSALRGAAAVATKARRAQKRGVDATRAETDHQEAVADADAMQTTLTHALNELRASWDPSRVTIGERVIAAKKTDVIVERCQLVWVPVAPG